MLKKNSLYLIAILLIIAFPFKSYAASVTLAWDANTDDVDGYRIYYGTSPGSHPNKVEAYNNTQYPVENLQENVRYYFIVRAYKGTNESPDSEEISWIYNDSDTENPTLSVNGPSTSTTSTVTLNGTASDNVAVTSVTWSSNRGGQGVASGTSSWTVGNIPLSSGENIITVTARDAAGNFANKSHSVIYEDSNTGDGDPGSGGGTTNNAPTATASVNTNSGDAPLLTNFTGSGTDSDGTIVSYRWNFGDGQTSSSRNPSHTYSTPGSYSATLTVTDDGGKTGTDSITITVNADTTPPMPPDGVGVQ